MGRPTVYHNYTPEHYSVYANTYPGRLLLQSCMDVINEIRYCGAIVVGVLWHRSNLFSFEYTLQLSFRKLFLLITFWFWIFMFVNSNQHLGESCRIEVNTKERLEQFEWVSQSFIKVVLLNLKSYTYIWLQIIIAL